MRKRFEELFPGGKPLIGVVHLPPLPGSPRYGGSMDAVARRALADAGAYAGGGAKGIIVENFGDYPFPPGRSEPQAIAAMASVLTLLRAAWPKMVFGVNVLRNDAQSAIGVAHAAGGRFIRVNVHTGAVLTDQGLIEGRADETLRFRRRIGADDVLIFADINVKHGAALRERDLRVVARETVARGMADGLIVTGRETGSALDIRDARLVKSAIRAPLLAGSGVTVENVAEILPSVDGLIVGTSLKRGGRTENPVDAARVKRLVKAMGQGARGKGKR
ncbi:MAG: phosphorybosylanthranilate isomerase [Planctomycetota bacterium]|nr:MAG: phosphorybosylanthranilate isomerase [Planctomycetota bacterium]